MNYYDPLVYVVPPEEDGWLLRTVLMRKMKLSRKLISRLKMTDAGIQVNNERRYVSSPVQADDRIEIRMSVETSEDILPQRMELDIVFEDEHLMIVNKPAGVIVHPTHGHYVNTLANGVVDYWRRKGESYRFRPIHRLDQETSGVLAIAKNPFVHQAVSQQMIANQVDKQYLAVVYGRLPFKSGKIDAPIDRSEENPHLRVVREDGYRAVTYVQVVEEYAKATIVKLRLETGRTHQIRVHMKYAGCPLIGDKLYLPEPHTDIVKLKIERHALHASELGLNHPVTHQRMRFTAPLPEDMLNLIKQINK